MTKVPLPTGENQFDYAAFIIQFRKAPPMYRRNKKYIFSFILCVNDARILKDVVFVDAFITFARQGVELRNFISEKVIPMIYIFSFTDLFWTENTWT